MSKKKRPSRVEAPSGPQGQPAAGASPAVVPSPAIASAAPLPEFPEPTVEKRPIQPWLIVLLVALLYWGDMYVMQYGADVAGQGGAFPTLVYDPYTSFTDLEKANPVSPEQAEQNKGRQVYNFVCVQCHQGNGQGLAGQFPPLVGSEWVQTEGTDRLIRIVLNGLAGPIEVKGQTFNNTMPPWKGTLNDEQIAHVLTFIRREWGNNAPRVTPEEVARVRQTIKTRESPFTSQELKNVPEKVQTEKSSPPAG